MNVNLLIVRQSYRDRLFQWFEQMIVGLLSLASIPISIGIGMTLFASRHDLAVFLSRMLIALAYAAGNVLESNS